MIETINGRAYLKVGDKVYELGGGSNIITADSVEQWPDPASVPEGTIALVKGESVGVDLSALFDYATSIMDGGSSQVIEGDFRELTNQFKKGTTKVKARLGEIICTVDVNAMIIPIDNGEAIQFNNFVENNFSLLWLETMITPTQLGYRVQKVSTQPYDPS